MMRVFEITIGMSLFIAVLLLGLKLFGGKFTAKCRYIIWALVMLRLAIPFSMGILPTLIEISIDTKLVATETLSSELSENTEPTAPSQSYDPGNYSVTPLIPVTPSMDTVIHPDNPQIIPLEQAGPVIDPHIEQPITLQRIFDIAGIVNLIGAAGFFGWSLTSYVVYTRKILRSAKPADNRIQKIFDTICEKYKLKKQPTLLVASGVHSPATFGIIHQRIILPDIAFTDNGLVGTLAHEVTHCKRGDLYVKLVELIACSLNWFNPLVHIAALKCEMEMELSCDEAVLAGCSEDTRAAYGEVMLDIIRRCRRNQGALTTHFNPKKNAVKARFANIINGSGKRKGMWLIAVCLVLCLIAGAIVACRTDDDILDGSEETDVSSDVMVTVTSLEELSGYLTDGVITQELYDFYYDLLSGNSDIPEYNTVQIDDYTIQFTVPLTEYTSYFNFTVTESKLDTLPPGTYDWQVQDIREVTVSGRNPDNSAFTDIPEVRKLLTFFGNYFAYNTPFYGEETPHPAIHNYIIEYYGKNSSIERDEYLRIAEEEFGITDYSSLRLDDWTDENGRLFSGGVGGSWFGEIIEVWEHEETQRVHITIQFYADCNYLLKSHRITYTFGSDGTWQGYSFVSRSVYEPGYMYFAEYGSGYNCIAAEEIRQFTFGDMTLTVPAVWEKIAVVETSESGFSIYEKTAKEYWYAKDKASTGGGFVCSVSYYTKEEFEKIEERFRETEGTDVYTEGFGHSVVLGTDAVYVYTMVEATDVPWDGVPFPSEAQYKQIQYQMQTVLTTFMTENGITPNPLCPSSIVYTPKISNNILTEIRGTYPTMETYVTDRMAQETTTQYFAAEPDGSFSNQQKTANVTDTKLLRLEKKGEVAGLAPEGVLECWEYKYLLKLDVPVEEVMIVGGQQEKDGWFDLEGQGNHTTVALRSPDGTYTVLRDSMVADGIDFTGYRNSYEEAIYDWYVTEYGLDLPLYVLDWESLIVFPEGEYLGNQPVHRFNGDGWGIYIPVSAWYQSTDAMKNQWLWRSSYNTGSTLMVDVFSHSLEDEYVTAEKQGYTPTDATGRVWEDYTDGLHSYYYYYENPSGGFWRVTIEWTDTGITDYPYIAIEPQLLRLMAESFVVFSMWDKAATTLSMASTKTPEENWTQYMETHTVSGQKYTVSFTCPEKWQIERSGILDDENGKRIGERVFREDYSFEEFKQEGSVHSSHSVLKNPDSPYQGSTQNGMAYIGYYKRVESSIDYSGADVYTFLIQYSDSVFMHISVWQQDTDAYEDFLHSVALPIVESVVIEQMQSDDLAPPVSAADPAAIWQTFLDTVVAPYENYIASREFLDLDGNGIDELLLYDLGIGICEIYTIEGDEVKCLSAGQSGSGASLLTIYSDTPAALAPPSLGAGEYVFYASRTPQDATKTQYKNWFLPSPKTGGYVLYSTYGHTTSRTDQYFYFYSGEDAVLGKVLCVAELSRFDREAINSNPALGWECRVQGEKVSKTQYMTAVQECWDTLEQRYGVTYMEEETLHRFDELRKTPDTSFELLADLLDTLKTENPQAYISRGLDGEIDSANRYPAGGFYGADDFARSLAVNYTFEPLTAMEVQETAMITLHSPTEGEWTIHGWANSNYVELITGGQSYFFRVSDKYGGDMCFGNTLKNWFDDAEYAAVPYQTVIPDTGQGFLAAAQTFTDSWYERNLQVSSGSEHAFSYVSCSVADAHNRDLLIENGVIGENTYTYYITVVFVPENPHAGRDLMVTVAGPYTGDYPTVPANAYDFQLNGYITLEEDGWHGEVGGAGW